MLQWPMSMGHEKCQLVYPMGNHLRSSPVWRCLYTSPMGMLQWSMVHEKHHLVYPMGNHPWLMVLLGPALHVSHEHISMVHGAVQMSPSLSHGPLYISNGPA
jgi:hypothetical protein